MTAAKVKEFWDQQAETFGTSDLATAPDHHYRELEISRIKENLIDGELVLDIGCGNGYSIKSFAKAFPKITFWGVDYSESMIKEAIKRKTKNTSYLVKDVLKLSCFSEAPWVYLFDTIISERCLINLANWDEQKHTILEMKKILKPNGRIILVENTFEGLQRLNDLREKFGLHRIEVRWHNKYLPEDELIDFLERNFTIFKMENIGCFFYLVSRVIYATLAKVEGKEPEYSHPINEIASKLPSLGDYHFSPNWLFVLRNK